MARRPHHPDDRTQGLGMFRGNPKPPQDLSAAGRRGMLTGTTMSAPGLRLARGRASRESSVYTGTGASPQVFVKQQGGSNNKSALGAYPKINSRRTVGAFRGLPSQAPGGADDR